MNPLASQAISSIIRHVLSGAAVYLVSRGIWTESQAAEYVGAAALSIAALGWSYFEKWKARTKFFKALESPAGTTEKAVDRAIKADAAKAKS